jgi:hypothetical protein
MADFAQWGEAVGRGLAWPHGKFLEGYNANRKSANEMILEDSPLASAIRQLAEKPVDWIGTPSELLTELTEQVGAKMAESKRWPKSPRALAGALRRLAPTFRMIGISLEFARDHTGRYVAVKSDAPRKEPLTPSRRDIPSPSLISQHENGDGRKSPASRRVTDRHAETLDLQPRDGGDANDGRIPTLSGLNGQARSRWVDPDYDYTRDP